MSDTHLIQPPKISVSAEASASHRIISPDRNIRQVNDKSDVEPTVIANPNVVPNARRMGLQFGATNGVQIKKPGQAGEIKFTQQSLMMLERTLGRLLTFCQKENGQNAASTVQATIDVIRRIGRGYPIADSGSDAGKKA